MQHALQAAWAAGREDGDGRGPALALAMAVQEFRELSRLDLVSAEQVRSRVWICGVFCVVPCGWKILVLFHLLEPWHVHPFNPSIEMGGGAARL